MQKNHILRFGLLLGILLVTTWIGCSERGTRSDNAATSVNMSLKVASPDMVDAISQFMVTVTGEDIDPPIEAPLILTGRYLEGVVLVPPGDDRNFKVEASDIEGAVLYAGDTTVSVFAGEPLVLNINLYPVISLVRVSPRYQQVSPNSDFFVDVKAFNVPELYGITFRLHWTQIESIVYPDSAGPLTPVGTDVLFTDRINPTLLYYEISLSNTDQLTPLVDANGDAELVRVYFRSFTPELLGSAAGLSVEVMQMTRLPADTIPLDSVKYDGSTVVVAGPAL